MRKSMTRNLLDSLAKVAEESGIERGRAGRDVAETLREAADECEREAFGGEGETVDRAFRSNRYIKSSYVKARADELDVAGEDWESLGPASKYLTQEDYEAIAKEQAESYGDKDYLDWDEQEDIDVRIHDRLRERGVE